MAELAIIRHPDTPNQIMRIYASDHDPAVHGPRMTEEEAAAWIAGDQGSDGLDDLTVAELKGRAEALGLDTDGKKAELVERIRAKIAGDQGSE